jgi:DNA-binding CsgD family transcriptional regulator/LysM repeat protein
MNSFDDFSEREQAVIKLLVQGKSNKQIALQLKISNRTVEFHLSNIYSKLGVSSRTEAVLLFMKDLSGEQAEEPVEITWRESTDAPMDEPSYNGEKREQRNPMKKRTWYLIGSGLLIAVFLALVFFIDPEHNLKNFFTRIIEGDSGIISVEVAAPQEDGSIIHTVEEGQTLWSIAVAYDVPVNQLRFLNQISEGSDVIYVGQQLYIRTASTQIPTSTPIAAENTFTQTLDSATVTLTVKWFYIDQTRLYLDLVVSGYPLPEDFSPLQLIDLQNVVIHRSDGSLIDLEHSIRYGGIGGGGGENSQDQEPQFFEGIIDVGLPSSPQENSQEEPYVMDILIGGEIYAENGEVRVVLPVVPFHIEVKPTYVGQLTFAVDESAVIDEKTVTFKGMEINPSNAAVLFCVFDPQGSQWLPSIHLLYKGNVLDEAGLALTDGDPSSQMCYRIYYTRSFQFDPKNDPRTNIAILVAKLVKDQPERLPYELVAAVQNDLAAQGIEFNYVIISHGSGIEVTKKPAGMTEEEAQLIIHNALVAEAVPEGTLIFHLP